jgi:hypothetical protein
LPLHALLLAASDFLNPDQGPEPSGGFRVSPSFFLVLFGLGFLVGAIGHLTRSRTLVAAGVLMIFLATVFLPIALQASH